MNNLGQRRNGSFGRRAFLIRMCLLVIAGVSISQSVFSQDEKYQPRGEEKFVCKAVYDERGEMTDLGEYIPSGTSFYRYEMVVNAGDLMYMVCDRISGYWYDALTKVEDSTGELCYKYYSYRSSKQFRVSASKGTIRFECGYYAPEEIYAGETNVSVFEYKYDANGYLSKAVEEHITGNRHYQFTDGSTYEYDEKGNWILEDMYVAQESGAVMSYSAINIYNKEGQLISQEQQEGGSSRCKVIYAYDSAGRVDSVYWSFPNGQKYLREAYFYDLKLDTIKGVLRWAAPQENVAVEEMEYGNNRYNKLNDIGCVGAFYDVDYVVSDKGDTLYTQLYRCHLLERQWEDVDIYNYGECSFTRYENGVLKTFDEGGKHYEFDERGMLRSVKLSDGSVKRSYDEHGTLLSYEDILFTNEYDENGKLISCMSDTVTSNTFIGGKNEFFYDEQDRLTGVKTYRKDENGVYVLYSYDFFEYGRSYGYTSVPLYTVSLDTVLQDMYYYVSDDGKTISSNGVVRPGETLPSDVLKADLSHYHQIVRVYETNIYGDTLGWSLKTINPARMEEVEVNVKNLVYEFDENDLLSVLQDKDGNRFYYSENGYLNRYERNDSTNVFFFYGAPASDDFMREALETQPLGEGRHIYVKEFNAEGKVLSLEEYNPQGISFSRIKQVQTDDGDVLMGCDRISGYWYYVSSVPSTANSKEIEYSWSESSGEGVDRIYEGRFISYKYSDEGYLSSYYYRDEHEDFYNARNNAFRRVIHNEYDEKGNPVSERETDEHGWQVQSYRELENFYDKEGRLDSAYILDYIMYRIDTFSYSYEYDSLGRVLAVYKSFLEEETYLSTAYFYDLKLDTIKGVLRWAAPQENVAVEEMEYGKNGYNKLYDIDCVGAFYDVDYVVSEEGDTLYTQLYRCHLLERQWEDVDTYDYGECSFTRYENGVLKTFDEGSRHYEFDERGMLRSVKLRDGSVERSYDEHGTLLTYEDVLFTNEYDENGKLISCMSDTVTSNTFIGGKNEFFYDEQDRLTGVKTYRKDENGVYVLYSYNFFEYGRSYGYTSVPLYTVSLDTVLQDMYYYVSDDGKTISSNGVVRPGDTLPSDVLKADLSHYPQIVRVYETNIYGDTLGWSLKTIDPASMEEVEVDVKNLVYEFDENDLLSVLQDKDGNRFYYSENGYLNRYERNDSTNVFFFYGAPASDDFMRDALNSLDVDDGDGLPSLMSENISLYTVEKVICIDGLVSDEAVQVYDLNGLLIGSGAGECVRIPVAAAGAYVVVSGKASAKVVVR